MGGAEPFGTVRFGHVPARPGKYYRFRCTHGCGYGGSRFDLPSAVFTRAPKLQRFLRYVCEQTLQGQAAQIKEYAIARDIFERGEDFSPNDDSVVRRQAHALRQKLQEYYADEGREESIKIELPVGRYVPVFRYPDIISGLDAQSTQEASEYLTDAAMVRQLLTRMKQLPPSHAGPWRFQIVLEAEVRDKVPTRANLAAVRVLRANTEPRP